KPVLIAIHSPITIIVALVECRGEIMKFTLLLVGLTVVSFSTACAPEPAKVCSHLSEVFKDNVDPHSYMADSSRCAEHFEFRKKQHGVNSYRREVECILATHRIFEIKECAEKEDRRNR